jgi:RND family efflux transporter MFP subunit
VEHNRYQELVDSRAARRDLLDEARYQLEAAQAACETVEARIHTADAKLHVARAGQIKVAADYESSLAAVAVAQADLQQVQTMLQYAEIRAEFDGYVTERYVDPGAFIQPAEGNSSASPLLTITRTDKVRIVLDIPMGEVRFLDRGDPAVLDRVNVLPGEQPFEGVVARFSPSLNTRSRMMRLEIDLENPDRKLLPGYYGYVTLKLHELADTPVIPSSAVMTEGNQAFVYVVEGGACRRCPITPNYQDGSIVGVSSGLVGGEQVIVSGGGQMVEGQRVSSIVSGAKKG